MATARARLGLPAALHASLLACVGVALLVTPMAARADEGDERGAVAEALFRAGREASARGDAATACAKFRESYRLDREYGTLLNIAVCEESLGELAAAWQHLHDVLYAVPPDDPWVAEARRHAEVVDRRLPRLTLTPASGAPADMHVSLEGVEFSRTSFGVPLPLDAGHHTFVVSAAGRRSQTYPVELREGDRVTLTIEPGAPSETNAADVPVVPSPAPAPRSEAASFPKGLDGESPLAREPEHARPPSNWRRTSGAAALGLAAGSLAAAATTGFLILDRRATVDAHCNAAKQCDPVGLEAGSSGRRLEPVGVTTLVLGLASGGLGFYFLTSGPPRSALTLHAVAAIGAGGLQLEGGF